MTPDPQDEPSSIPLAELAPANERLASPVRFCGGCGAPWDPAWAECPYCTKRSQTVPARSYKRELSSIRSAIALYFALLAVSFFTILVVAASKNPLSASGEMVVSAIFSLVVVCWCLSRPKQLWGLITTPFSPVWLVVAATASVGTYLLASAVVYALQNLGVHMLRYSDSFASEGYGFGWVVLVVCVQPAIFEELSFRGFIQSSLMEVMGRQSIVVSAMMFGILHLSIPSLPHLVIIGLVLAWLRVKTGSLLPGMLMHFMHNFLVTMGERAGGILPW